MVIRDAMHFDEFNRHHGTDFNHWDEIRDVIGYKGYGDIDGFTICYLNWLKVVDTPLYAVLEEHGKD